MWRAAYSLVLYLALPLAAARLLWRAWRNPAYLGRWRERFGVGRSLPQSARLWVHAVSVGEVAAAAPLILALLGRYRDHTLLVTTTTPTGSAEVRRRFGDRVEHRYLPLDLPHITGRLVRALRPRLLMVMETELWPNLFASCRAHGVPIMLVNGRLSERSMRGYRRVRPLVQETLDCVTALAARSDADARRFRALGVDSSRVRVPGNVKYDLPSPVPVGSRVIADRPVWIAASTHAGEDERLLAVHRSVLERIPGALLILVPRHPERFESVARICGEAGLDVARRSRGEIPDAATAVWLGDTMGELPELFSLADVAFMGGSLVPTGGHNPLEAAVHGLPVLTGPHVFNFQEVFDALDAAGGARVVSNDNDLADTLILLFGDPAECMRRGQAASRVVAENRGAVDRVVAWVEELVRTGE